MNFLRFLGMLMLMYVTARMIRSLRDSVSGPPGGGGAAGPGRRPSPFDDYGPFGRFGPFGPFGPQGPGRNGPGGPGQNPRPGAGPGPGWYDPFAGAGPFAGANQGAYAPPAQPAQPRPKGPYEILGVRPGTPMTEVRKAYQDLVRQYHPDKVDGLGPELRSLAEQRTKEITAAYNQLKRNG